MCISRNHSFLMNLFRFHLYRKNSHSKKFLQIDFKLSLNFMCIRFLKHSYGYKPLLYFILNNPFITYILNYYFKRFYFFVTLFLIITLHIVSKTRGNFQHDRFYFFYFSIFYLIGINNNKHDFL